MNWLDFVLLLVFVIALYNGFRKGLVSQVISLTSFFIALYLALTWSDEVRDFLGHYLYLDRIVSVFAEDPEASLWLVETILNIISFLVAFLVISLILALISGKLKLVNKIPLVGPVNAFFGLTLGAVKGILFVFLLVALSSLVKTEYWLMTMESSAIVALSEHYMSQLFELMMDYVAESLSIIDGF